MTFKPNSPKQIINQPYLSFLKSLDKHHTTQYLSYKDSNNLQLMLSNQYHNMYLKYTQPNNSAFDANVQKFLNWQKDHEMNLDLESTDKLKVHRAPIKEKVNIDIELRSLDDLISIIDTYPLDDTKEYNIDIKSLHKIGSELKQLQKMVGLTTFKKSVLKQILYFVQGFTQDNHGDYKHTVITGPPGTGKTEIAKIIGNMYSKIGILKNNVFKKVTRTDLVAGYLGQTAIKTRKKIDECLGGVMFIDEAYSLQTDDMYAKECVDTLCEALSDHKKDLMVIIAGYENELNEKFFKINNGLPSRFVWRFHINEYNANELYNIFAYMTQNICWTIDSGITEQWFCDKKEHLSFNGRSIEQLVFMCKIAHSNRIFGKEEEMKKKLTLEDLSNGFELYKENMKSSKDNIFLGLYT